MQFSFYARSYEDYEEAKAAFDCINERMHAELPNAFVTVAQDIFGFTVMFGCHDHYIDFANSIAEHWVGGEPCEVDIEVWMALEANHARECARHHAEHEGEDFRLTNTDGGMIMPDGTRLT